MKRGKKTWTQKLDQKTPAKIVELDREYAGVPAGGGLFVPTPRLVEAYVRKIPKGVSVTPQTLRKDLATEHKADGTCPLTTGIFLRIVAEAAYEQYLAGTPLKDLAPFWRVIDLQSPTAKKLTFGTDFLKTQREKEKLAA
ncbi:MAG: hypothetical protein HOP19_10525 [Acidobacteria bacterium]|nr:hypothetical protein [Acidobacteriota bacterium]